MMVQLGKEINTYALHFLMCILLLYSFYQVDKKYKLESSAGKPYLDRWTSLGRFHEPIHKALLDIRNIKEDFVFIGFDHLNTSNKGTVDRTSMNRGAMKSKYTSDIWNYLLNADVHRVQLNMRKTLDNFLASVNEGKMYHRIQSITLKKMTFTC